MPSTTVTRLESGGLCLIAGISSTLTPIAGGGGKGSPSSPRKKCYAFSKYSNNLGQVRTFVT